MHDLVRGGCSAGVESIAGSTAAFRTAPGYRDQDGEHIEKLVRVRDMAGVDLLYGAMFGMGQLLSGFAFAVAMVMRYRRPLAVRPAAAGAVLPVRPRGGLA